MQEIRRIATRDAKSIQGGVGQLVTIASGALHFSLPVFVAASVVTRGARFLLVSWLFQRFGPALGPVIEKRLGLVLLGVAAVVIGGFVLALLIH